MTFKHLKPEGDTYSQFVQEIQRAGYSKPVDFEIGTVLVAPPEIIVRLDSSPIELDKDDLTIAERVTNHKRIITIRKQTELPKWTTKINMNSTKVDDTMTANGAGPHTHDITSLGLNDVQEDFTFEQAEIEYLDELRKGDRVIVAKLLEQMRYVIIDRARWY